MDWVNLPRPSHPRRAIRHIAPGDDVFALDFRHLLGPTRRIGARQDRFAGATLTT
jgi:hypothetical protein